VNKQELKQRFLAACAVAHEAGWLMRRHYRERSAGRISFKGPQDFLTVVDGAVERLVVERLGQAFPGDRFVGEEGGGTFGPRTWVIDPIDGTSNFARGMPHFCISIAFLDGKRPTIGVIYDPIADELFAARRGGGATVNGRPMRVSGTTDLRRATVELGWSTRRTPENYTQTVQSILAAGGGFHRSGSGALGLAYVADGRNDGYFEAHINAWDALAALVMVREAGGWTNNFLAGDGLRKGNAVLACTPGLRAILQKLTRSAVGADKIGNRPKARTGRQGRKL
jgi:myo-inositol-1(or 4)-monophosphatase